MNPLPPDFPPELAAAALVLDLEAAWSPEFAVPVVEWLGSHGYAVLGTELWLVQDDAIISLPIGTSELPEVHGNIVSNKRAEGWKAYVHRAAIETIAYLQGFDPKQIVQKGELYFNVVWVGELEYANLHAT
jgi:hypothetical protein